MTDERIKCPSCGHRGAVITNNVTGKIKVECAANDSENIESGECYDWCPDEQQTKYYETEAEAMTAWNERELI